MINPVLKNQTISYSRNIPANSLHRSDIAHRCPSVTRTLSMQNTYKPNQYFSYILLQSEQSHRMSYLQSGSDVVFWEHPVI